MKSSSCWCALTLAAIATGGQCGRRLCPNATVGSVSLQRISKSISKAPPLDNAAGPTPSLYILSWKHLLRYEDIRQIVDFLWSMDETSKVSR